MGATLEPAELLAALTRASDAVFAVDASMRVVFWNEAAERIFGVDAGAAVGSQCDDIVAGREPSGPTFCKDDCLVMACARRGRAAENYDLVRTDDGGRTQWLNVSILVLRGRRRESTLTVHLVRDVTARRTIEQRSLAALRGPSEADSARELPSVTRRETEVLRLLASGASNSTIASTLGISATTVRNHIEHLLAKLGVHSKLEAVVYAAQRGLV